MDRAQQVNELAFLGKDLKNHDRKISIKRTRKEYSIPNSRSRDVVQHETSIVKDIIANVGPAYGCKMITGCLNAIGYSYSGRSIRNRWFCSERADALPMLSDAQIPFYIVFHFGETLQVDQHEKLPEWSVYDVLFSDGFTR